MTGEGAGFCTRLADFAWSFELASLGGEARAHLVDAFLNWFACAVSGASHSTVDAATTGLTRLSGGGSFRPIGRLQGVGFVDVAVIDCLSSAVLAYDDIHFATGLHPTGPVAAALLALSRREAISGLKLFEALHVGMEIQCRIALAYAGPGTGAKLGWYATGIAGGIGAAAAVARCLGADCTEIAAAMSLAAARACGNRGTHGSMAAAYVPSTGAESGLVSAFLARDGLLCANRALDGVNGLLELLADRPDSARAVIGLGAEPVSAKTSFKPYPSGFVTHAAIDACLELHARGISKGAQVKGLDIAVSPSAHALGANPQPADVPQAQVSVAHWASIALLTGAAGIEEADARWIDDRQVADMRASITIVGDPGLASDQCRVRVVLTDGSEMTVAIDHARGSPDRPMSSSDVDAKAGALLRSALPPEGAERLQGACRNLLELDDVASGLGI